MRSKDTILTFLAVAFLGYQFMVGGASLVAYTLINAIYSFLMANIYLYVGGWFLFEFSTMAGLGDMSSNLYLNIITLVKQDLRISFVLYYFCYFILQSGSFPAFILSFICLPAIFEIHKSLCHFAIEYRLSLLLYILDFNKQYRTEKLFRLCGSHEFRGCCKSQEDLDSVKFLLRAGADVKGVYSVADEDVTFLSFILDKIVTYYNWGWGRGNIPNVETDENCSANVDRFFEIVGFVASGCSTLIDKCPIYRAEKERVDYIYYRFSNEKMINHAIIWAKYFTLDFSDKEDSVLQCLTFVPRQCMMTLMLCWHRVANQNSGGRSKWSDLLSFLKNKNIDYPKVRKDPEKLIYYHVLRSYGFPHNKCTKEITGVTFTF